MRIRRLWIDGYGCFSERGLELHDGFQVVIGPNEQGKTTVRNFICDMLYGQKQSVMQPRYNGGHDLRRPWENPEVYGGRLTYVLDDGTEIEVVRNFDDEHESVAVRDVAQDRDITGTFPVLRNREPLFADTHIGISKPVFVSTANISHMALDHLANEDALAQIRERLLALSDSGEEDGSAEAAIARLEARIAAIGLPNAHAKPLPAARARLNQLQREHEQALAAREEIARMESRRRAVATELARLQERRTVLDANLKTLSRADQLKRIEEAEALQRRLEEVTQKCFALAAARTFPTAHVGDVRRIEASRAATQAQLERSETELEATRQQIGAERDRLGAALELRLDEAPEEFEQKLLDYEAVTQRLRQKEEELAAEAKGLAEAYQTAQQQYAALPDFGRLSADPLAWLNQLATSFRISQRARNDERAKLSQLRAELHKIESALIEPERIFAGLDDFPTAVRHYERTVRLGEDALATVQAALDETKAEEQDHLDRLPGYVSMLALFVVVGLVCAGAGIYFQNPGAYIPAGLAGLGAMSYALFVFHTRRAIGKVRVRLAELRADMVLHEDEYSVSRQDMDNRIAAAGLNGIRELEAYYEDYRRRHAEWETLHNAVDEQEVRAREEEESLTHLFERLQETFQDVGETLTDESQVADASARAVARYQEYRDVKRRFVEVRQQYQEVSKKFAQCRADLKAALETERELSLEARQFLRDNGFRDESHHASALNALRAYRMRSAQLRQKRGRLEVLQEKADTLAARLESERQTLAGHDASLRTYFDEAGVDSLAAYFKRYEEAEAFREARDQRASLEEQLAALLKGRSIETWRAEFESGGPLGTVPVQSTEAIQATLATLGETEAALRNEDRELEVAIAERASGPRPLSAIEEERAAVAAQVERLEHERQATARAATIIEETARKRHAQMAPRLAERASRFFREIAGDGPREIVLTRDLAVSVRLPKLDRVNDDPEQSLSKGTLDQIYFALRLAVVQALSERGEQVPMLLDDPFANYDDTRLSRVMTLLADIGKETQVLVFTCREDVARAAESVQAPVIRL